MKSAEEKFWEALQRLIERQEQTEKEIRELRELQKQTEEAIKHLSEENKKTSKEVEKVSEEVKKTSEEVKKTSEEIRKTDKQIKKTSEEVEKVSEEVKKTSESLRKLDNLVADLAKNVGGLNNAFGKIPEALSQPQIEEVFEKRGFNVLKMMPDLWAKHNNKRKEVDMIIVARKDGKNYVIVVETQVQFKSKKEIDEHIKFWKEDFKKFFPEYKNYDVIGCVCALRFGRGVDTYAIRQGLFCMKPVKGIMDIINPPDFKFKKLS